MSDGTLTAVVGASRSGKTAWVKEVMAKYKNAIIWDIEEQYHCQVRLKSQDHLINHLVYRGAECGVVCYSGKVSDFDFFCQAVWEWMELCRASGVTGALVAEETADVTNPGKAPDSWGVIIRRGLKRGIDIFAITQRPQESDKTAIGNATQFHLSWVAPADRGYMSRVTGVPVAVIEDILFVRDDENKAKNRFGYLSIDLGRKVFTPGVLSYPRGKAKFQLGKDTVSI